MSLPLAPIRESIYNVTIPKDDPSHSRVPRAWSEFFIALQEAGDASATDIATLQASLTALTATVTTLSGTVTTLAATVAAIGNWTSVSYSAGNYTANGGMSWTVQSGDVQRHAYAKFGTTMILAVSLTSTTVGGALNTDLRVAIPGGFTATHPSAVTGYGFDNGGSGILTRVSVTTGAAFVAIQLSTPAVPWQAASDATDIAFTFAFEVA